VGKPTAVSGGGRRLVEMESGDGSSAESTSENDRDARLREREHVMDMRRKASLRNAVSEDVRRVECDYVSACVFSPVFRWR
jgi:hypothetical protein